MSQALEMLKIGGRTRRYIKEHTYVSMEVVQGTRTCRHHFRCIGCEARCDFHFITHGMLRSASVAMSAGVFYSLCKNLGLVEEEFPVPDGQPSLSSDVNEE